MSNAREELERCLRLLDMKDYYNGRQTVRDRFPAGSAERERIVSEAAFWRSMLGGEGA